MMRIVFMGTADFGIPTLRALHDGHEVAAVVTKPDKPQGRGRSVRPTPVKEAARDLGIPVMDPHKLTDDTFLGELRAVKADLFIVVAFRILPPEVFTIPPRGTVNLHASLLPDYRGAAPVNRAVINGDSETGVTTFFIEETVDTGDILLSRRTAIGPDETAGELYDRLKEIGAELAVDTVEGIEQGTLSPVPQPQGTSRPAPKLHKEDAEIDWSLPAQAVHNHVRGMNPVPGAWTLWDGKKLKIHRTGIAGETAQGSPGTLAMASARDGLAVACGSGAVELIEVQPPGKTAMDGASFVRGHKVEEGMVLGRGTGIGDEASAGEQS